MTYPHIFVRGHFFVIPLLWLLESDFDQNLRFLLKKKLKMGKHFNKNQSKTKKIENVRCVPKSTHTPFNIYIIMSQGLGAKFPTKLEKVFFCCHGLTFGENKILRYQPIFGAYLIWGEKMVRVAKKKKIRGLGKPLFRTFFGAAGLPIDFPGLIGCF